MNYGDIGSVLINHLHIVIPLSYPCHYTNLCPRKPHKPAHTHTHTHTHTDSPVLQHTALFKQNSPSLHNTSIQPAPRQETHTRIFVNIHTLHCNELSVHTWNSLFPSSERVNKQTVCEFNISVLLRIEPQAVMSASLAASCERSLSSSTKITKT